MFDIIYTTKSDTDINNLPQYSPNCLFLSCRTLNVLKQKEFAWPETLLQAIVTTVSANAFRHFVISEGKIKHQF